MKKNYIILVFLLSSFVGYGQCNAFLTTQAEVNNFAVLYPGCTTMTSVTVAGSSITNLDGLSQITAVIGDLLIISQTSGPPGGPNDYPLTDISGLNNITSVGGTIHLSDLKNLTTSSIFQGLNYVGGIEITSMTPIVLSGFYNLLSANSISISSTTLLVQLSAFTFLSYCGDFSMNSNLLLSTAGGFVNLETIDSYTVSNNPNLLALPGMPNLTAVNGVFSVSYNDALPDLSGVESLASVNNFNITFNDGLTSLDGMENMTSVGISINIGHNPLLTNLSDLSNVTTMTGSNTGINISFNGLLNNLAGLNNIGANTIGSVAISGNPNLSVCSITNFCEKITLDGGVMNFTFSSPNAVGCNNGQEINDACQILSTAENNFDNAVTVYPNPVKNKLYYTNTPNNSSVSIVDLLGRTYIDYFTDSDDGIDVSQLSDGIYILVMNTEDGIVRTKFIKE